MFRLALALGRTVGELFETITLDELEEWAEFYALEPFGEWRADVRSAHIVTTLANINRDPKQREKPYAISDFMLFEHAENAAVQNAKEPAADGAVISQTMIAWLFGKGAQSKNVH